MKKIIASLAAIATVLSLSVASFAVDPGSSNDKVEGSETVKADKATDFVMDNGNKVVAAAGAFEAGKEVTVTLQATEVDNAAASDVAEAVAAAEGGKDVELNTKVSITATSDGVAVQPNGDITITVAYDDKSNAVAYVGEDKKVEAIELNVAEDKKTASFTVSHFSDFYMVKVADVNAFLGKNSGGDTNPDPNKPTGIAIAIVPAAIAAVAVVVSKKRK